MIIKQILLLLLLFLILFSTLRIIYSLFYYVFSKNTFAMYVPSFNRHIRLMQQYLSLDRWKRLIDLWCGDAKAMRFFARTFGLQCDGYEFQSFPYMYGKICNYILAYPQLNLYKGDFLQADLKRYDYIYIYLLPQQMAAIESRVFTHMSSSSIIISNSFQFAVHQPYEIIKDAKWKPSIFLYKK